MKREEEIIKGLESVKTECGKYLDEGFAWICEPIDMAIKALENYSAIRAEIEAYGSIWVQYTIPGHTDKDIEQVVENVLKQAKEQVLEIIDRHIGKEKEDEVSD